MRKTVRSTKKVLFIIIIACILFAALIKIVKAFKSVDMQLSKKQYYSNSLSSDDSSLFRDSAWTSLKVNQVFHLEGENPLYFLSYSEVFDLAICKFGTKDHFDLSNCLQQENIRAYATTGINYYTFPLNDFLTYEFASTSVRPMSRLHLTLYGDSLRCDSSKMAETFWLLCKNLSIRADDDKILKIFVTGREGLLMIIDPTPLEVKFLQRGKFVYVLMLTPKNENSAISSDVLGSILN